MSSIGDIAIAVQEDLRGQVGASFLSDDEVAGVCASAVGWVRLQLQDIAPYQVGGRVAGQITTDSTVTPDVDVDSPWGQLIRLVALWKIAVGGMMVQGEKNFGLYRGLGHYSNRFQTVLQQRLNAVQLRADVTDAIDGILHTSDPEQQSVDYHVLDAISYPGF